VSNYREYLAQDRRLVILRILAELPGYNCNSSILADMLERYAHQPSRDQIHTDLAWLAEQGLVQTEKVESVRIATITQHGLDVAAGRATVPGVKRPGPGG
jgi:Fe2+ or Zn2+ uptake regulation protein